MLKIILIRHLATEGNMKKRYIGITDQPLCEEGFLILEHIKYPSADTLYVSPLRRCRETAKLIYPDMRTYVYEDLRECNFGEFENKSYLELKGNEKYQAWVDSNATLPFPNGESPEAFKKRSIDAFQTIIGECIKTGVKTVALVVHGGTIMSILERFAEPKKDFYHWEIDNGNGYIGLWEETEEGIKNLCKIY